MADSRRIECHKKGDDWYEAVIYSPDDKILSREYDTTRQGAINEALFSAPNTRAENKEKWRGRRQAFGGFVIVLIITLGFLLGGK